MTQTKQTIEEKILNQIREHNIKQKPKWQFVLHTFFLSTITLVALLLTLYLVAFISLISDEHELINMFGLGPQFTLVFLKAIPWMLIGLLVVIFIILQILIRYFSFAYTRSVLVTLAATFLVIVCSNLILVTLDPRHNIARFGERSNIPVLREMHSTFRNEKQRGAIRGVIADISNTTYTVETIKGSTTVTFLITPSTRILSQENLKLGDVVLVVASQAEGFLQASVVRNEISRNTKDAKTKTPLPREIRPRPVDGNI